MRRMIVIVVLGWLFVGSQAFADDGDIKVMTYNQYLGADFTALAGAADLEQFSLILVGILGRIADTDFDARARRQGEQIARHRPDLVGLQEVWTLECTGPACSDPTIAGAFADHEAATLAALSDLGADYQAVARVKNVDQGFPFFVGDAFGFLQVTDRDVILARADAVDYVDPVVFPGCDTSEDGCNYQVALSVPVLGGVADFPRGFVAVDARVRGQDYLFVNTHLEVREPPIPRIVQSLQAQELIGRLDLLQATNPWARLIVVGDMNSAPEDQPEGPAIPPYQQFIAEGYVDTWLLRPGMLPGFTCCQDDTLDNQRSTLDERIDLIFSLDTPWKVKQARVVGANVSDKTRPPGRGLWPSDHGGVVATLEFE